MKLAQILIDNAPALCALTEKGLVSLAGDGYTSMTDALERPEGLKSALASSLCAPVSPENARFLPVVTRPGKVACVGVNYRRHILECGEKLPSEPVIFNKFPTALAAQNDVIAIPGDAAQLDYEAELVLVIGRRGRNIPVSDAAFYIFGCTCGNDLSARDWQFKSSQWFLGKTPDGFAPVGPYVVTSDSIDMQSLDIACRLNGETRQHSNTSDMIFSCAEIVSYLSRAVTLEPGDLIFTGTPDGVILGRPEGERVWMKPGDVVEIDIAGIGTLKNTIGERE